MKSSLNFIKNISKICLFDFKKIFKNRAAILILIAICILPSLYAWFYLKSSWDPYGNTRWLKVAVVNNDEWVMFEWSYLNIWNDIVEELKQDDNIWWVFVDEKVAEEWTRLWQYYANIVIETWFSANFVTFLDEEPQNPKLVYTVNEKVNAIASKITNAWTSTIKENIERQFIRTVDEVVMSKMNEIWSIVQNDEKSIYRFIDMVHNIKTDVYELDDKVDNVMSSTNKIKKKLQNINSKIPESYNVINSGKSLLSDTRQLTQNTLSLLSTAPQTIKNDISITRSDFNSIERQVSRLLDTTESHKSEINSDVRVISSDIGKLRWKVSKNISFLSWAKATIQNINLWNNLSGSIISWQVLKDKAIAPIDKLISKYTTIDNRLKMSADLLWYSQDILNNIDKRNDLKSSISDLENDFDDITEIVDDDIIPQFEAILDQLYDLSDRWASKLDEIENKIPEIQQDIDSGIEMIDNAMNNLEKLKEELPWIQASVSKVDNSLQTIKNNNVMNNFLSIALLNPDRLADFFSAPIELVENKLFSIPNYWSAMAPFFTVLAIWIWSLLLVALFTTRVTDSQFLNYKDSEKFFGKRLFFLVISIVQWLMVSLWDILLLWVYTDSPWAFILTAIACSFVFSMAAFSCVTTFWNSGKAILIVFLVLQLSWSGWTFPVEMSDPFFQTINPYLPFTYAIKAMREAVWWVIPEIFYMNLLILLGFFGIFAIMWLILKPLISKHVELFDHKFAESELWA